MTYQFVTIERSEHVATITLNQPERLNALSQPLTRDLHLALDEVGAEFPEIRAIILTGAGRGFCSGADVGEQADRLRGGDQSSPTAPGQQPGYDPYTSIPLLAPHIRNTPQPVIAAINGVAAGAGLSIAVASDIRIAAEVARFACIFVKRSLVPDTGSSVSLTDLVGYGTAAEMAYTGRMYDAAWALDHRLVNDVVPGERLLEEARALAREIAGNPPLCVRAIKPLLYRRQRLEDALPYEHDANTPSMRSADRREAVMSFMEKREPVFHGR